MNKSMQTLLQAALFFAVVQNTVLANDLTDDLIDNSAIFDEIVVKGRILYANEVNALKMPIPALDVPQSLSIVTDLDIKERGYRALGDIVRYTPGVNSSQGEGHRDAIVFRGNRSTADFYIDGVRDDVQYYRGLYNLEQVEVLRGPNALLFGRGGTGGTVNRVTKKAVLDEVFTNLDAAADRFGAIDFAADINRETGTNSALRVTAHYDSLKNDRDFYEGDRYGFNPALKIRLGDATMFDLSYEYANHQRFIDRGIPTADGRPVAALADITFGDKDINLTTLEAHIIRGLLNHEFSATLKGNVTLHYGDYDKSYRNLYASGYDHDAQTVTLDGYLDPTQRSHLVLNANLVAALTTGTIGHTLLLGGEYVATDSQNYRYNTHWTTSGTDKESFVIRRPLNLSVNAAGQATSVDFTSDLNSYTETDITVASLYFQDQIDLSERVKLLLGGRFDSFDITVEDIKNTAAQSRTDDVFSPRAGLIYKPQDNISLYAGHSESFLPRSGEQYKKLDTDAARLDPDVFENTEIGLKWDIAPDLSVTSAYFQSRQIRAVRDNTTGESAEIRGLQIDGFEIELKGRIDEKLQFAAGYSAMEGETATGQTPRELPETMLSLWAAYLLTPQLEIGVGVTYQDETKITDNAASPMLPDYTRIDVAMNYTLSEEMVLRLNLENLSDTLYFPHAHSTHQASVGDPFNARLSLTRRF